MNGGQAFRNGFILGVAFFAGTCVAGCTAADRAGHRAEVSVLRMEADGGSFSSASNGPGPHDTAASGSLSDSEGWAYGLGYSVPMGDDPSEHQLRLLRADFGGWRADLEDFQASMERLTVALDAHTESLELAAYRRSPAPAQAVEDPAPATVESSQAPEADPSDSEEPPAWLSGLVGAGAPVLLYGVWTYRRLLLSIAAAAWPFGKSRPPESNDG
ncbi:MAG TPA: hypothetical protein VFD43_00275 [Planctomycetota bacterium]|nr:hypothetical protein [Planctomycetota bacterium]